jgi:hypothetical protein
MRGAESALPLAYRFLYEAATMKPIVFVHAVLFCLLVLPACRNEPRVHASGEEAPSGHTETYAPLPPSPVHPANQPIQGELRRVNLGNRTFVIRLQNGMDQTFIFDDQTTVSGAPEATGRAKTGSQEQMARLVGRDGSELVIQWTADGSDKIARSVDVLQLTTATKKRTRNY